MTEEVKNINETINRLEKCIEGLKQCNNSSIASDKNEQDKESGLQKAMLCCEAFCKGFFKGYAIAFLIMLVSLNLFMFIVFSYRMLDLNMVRYVDFVEDSTCRFYQLFGYCEKPKWGY